MLTLALLPLFITAQASPPKPPPESHQFDFWLGEWNADGTSYNLQDPKQTQKTTGTNRITREMNGFVVHEHFKSPGFNGESWSVYVPAANGWRQTWVDDGGGYIPLRGSFEDGKMTLATPPNPASPDNQSRMVFFNIEKNAFDWNWEKTADAGKIWQVQWHIHYTRKR